MISTAASEKASNLFANSVLALDAATGERKWHYQTVHHDIWDYDNPPAPILVTLTDGATSRDAVVQFTKMGFTFVLDRDTGQPLFPVQEVPVPRSTVPGEEAWPTQPIPLKPRPLVRQSLTEADLTNITPAAHAYALKEFRQVSVGIDLHAAEPAGHDHAARPPRRQRMARRRASIPCLNVLYVNVNEVPTINRLRPGPRCARGRIADSGAARPADLRAHLRACHGADRQGTPPQTPALVNVKTSRQEHRDGDRAGAQQHAGVPAVCGRGD